MLYRPQLSVGHPTNVVPIHIILQTNYVSLVLVLDMWFLIL